MSVAFAAGDGITPALSLVSRLMGEAPANRVLLFYGHHAGDHPAAIEALFSLKDRHLDRLSVAIVMEREPDEAELLSGKLDGAKIKSIAARLFELKDIQDYFVCGPDSLAAEVRAALGGLGVDVSRIHVEETSEAGGVRSAAGAAPALHETLVSFVMDGRRRSFTMHTGEESILDAAGRAGIDLPFSCKAGVCSTCRTKLVRGEVEMAENYALEDWELQQGFILACQSRAKTPEIELTYDET
ncbi:MAG: 2Fe-2S iron-sulfur cluster-binding protein [Gammaproteobacteria bacterium]